MKIVLKPKKVVIISQTRHIYFSTDIGVQELPDTPNGKCSTVLFALSDLFNLIQIWVQIDVTRISKFSIPISEQRREPQGGLCFCGGLRRRSWWCWPDLIYTYSHFAYVCMRLEGMEMYNLPVWSGWRYSYLFFFCYYIIPVIKITVKITIAIDNSCAERPRLTYCERCRRVPFRRF